MNNQNRQAEKRWAEILRRFPEANFLQSPAWQRVNELVGHKTVVESSEKSWCLMIIKNARRGRYLEIPGGPLVDWDDAAEVERIFRRVRAVGRGERCVFARLRPQLESNAENRARLIQLGARRAPMHLHAEHTVIIDLTKSESDLLKNMRKQTRYEVRRAAKLGIRVEWSDDEALFREFCQAQQKTAARQHFIPPDLHMLLAERAAFDGESTNGINETGAKNADKTSVDGAKNLTSARIYVARTADGDAIAYGLILIDGVEAEYFEAASTDLGRKLPGAYALLWQAICDLKNLGAKRFNLWGIAPINQQNNAKINAKNITKSTKIKPQKSHRYAGVTTFKTGFGGEIVEFVPAHDLVFKRARYALDWIIETLRKKRRKL